MSKEHNHHHEEIKHDHPARPKVDFGSLWRATVKIGIWVIYPILMICLFHVVWLMNDRMDNIMYNTVPINDRPAAFVDIKLAIEGSVQKGMDLKLIKEPSSAMLKLGKTTYQTTCAACHGPEGRGGINNSRNFHSKENWKSGQELRNMFTTVTNGLPGTGMGPFDTLPVETRISVIHYIRLFTKEYPAVTDKDVEFLDKQYNLSKETINPHRVPITVATQILVEEAAMSNKKNFELSVKVANDSKNEAMLLKAYTDNLDKTISSLQSNVVWQKDLESFTKFLTVNIGVNGVKADLLLLEKAQLEDLFKYLRGIYK